MEAVAPEAAAAVAEAVAWVEVEQGPHAVVVAAGAA